jgi:hypothetical protein
VNGNNAAGNGQANASGIINNGASGTQNMVNPVTGLNVQISTKKCKSTASPCAVSPVLLECPEQDCSKKYKHANGLKYHQSHAHPSSTTCSFVGVDEDSSQAPESPTAPSPTPIQQAAAAANGANEEKASPVPSLPVRIENFSIGSGKEMANTVAPIPAQPVAPPPQPPVAAVTSGAPSVGLLATTPSAMANPTGTSTPSGGSITTGIAGQPQNLTGSSSVILGTPAAIQEPLSPMSQQQQQQQNSITTTPVRTDGSVKVKSSVLRFGPGTNEGQNLPGAPSPLLIGNSQTPLRNPSMPGTPETSAFGQQTPQGRFTFGQLYRTVVYGYLFIFTGLKTQSFSKQKKNRKSPGPDFDNSSSSRAEDVQSPAYSDISDDSTPVVEASDVGEFDLPRFLSLMCASSCR